MASATEIGFNIVLDNPDDGVTPCACLLLKPFIPLFVMMLLCWRNAGEAFQYPPYHDVAWGWTNKKPQHKKSVETAVVARGAK